MLLNIEIYKQLEAFRLLITNIINNPNVQYAGQKQSIQKNNNRPNIELEFIRSETEAYDSYNEDNDTTIQFIVVSRQRLIIHVHCLFRGNDKFEAYQEAVVLQGLLNHESISSLLDVIQMKVSRIDSEQEELEAIEYNSNEFDNRIEHDYYFPIVLSIANKITSPVLGSGWFNAVELTTDIDDIDDSLNLDDERIEAQ